MTVEDNRVGWRFWLWWVLASTVGLGVAAVVGTAVVLVAGYSVTGPERLLPMAGWIVALAVGGLWQA